MDIQEALTIIKKHKKTNFNNVSAEDKNKFQDFISSCSTEQIQEIFPHLMSVDEHSICYIKTKQAEKQGFNLKTHLSSLLNDVLPTSDKDIISRLDINDEMIYMHNIRGLYSTDEFYPSYHPKQIEGRKNIERLIGDFTNNDSVLAQKLKETLDLYPLRIHIAKSNKDSTINGNADFSNKQFTLTITESALDENNLDKLPGMLAHELSHLIDYASRPDGYMGHMAGEETFADIYGQKIAENAGYDSRPWARYIADNDKREYYAKGIRPSGSFRLDSILQSESQEKRIGSNLVEAINKDISQYQKIRENLMSDDSKDRLTKVTAAADTIFTDILNQLNISDKTQAADIKHNKYCLMGIMKSIQNNYPHDQLEILPDNLSVIQSNEQFIKHCQQSKSLSRYVKTTQNIDTEKNIKIGTLFIMTNITDYDVYKNNQADDLSHDNHANIIVGKSTQTGEPLLSAFSEENIAYHPNTFKKGYLVDVVGYLNDYENQRALSQYNIKNYNR